jgi:hypothetical protein
MSIKFVEIEDKTKTISYNINSIIRVVDKGFITENSGKEVPLTKIVTADGSCTFMLSYDRVMRNIIRSSE